MLVSSNPQSFHQSAVLQRLLPIGCTILLDLSFTNCEIYSCDSAFLNANCPVMKTLIRYCSKSVLLKKEELLEVIKRSSKLVSTIPIIRKNTF